MQASRHDEAEQLFRQAQLMAPSDPTVYMFTGKLINIQNKIPRKIMERGKLSTRKKKPVVCL